MNHQPWQLSRRIIRALRAGVVSEESADALSVGTEPLLQRLAAFLDGDAQVPQRTLLVPGDWGFGKSHVRMLCSVLLARRGLAFIRGAVNGKTGSLAHLHRCVPHWLETIQFNGAYGLRRALESGALDRRQAQLWRLQPCDLFGIALNSALRGSEAGWFRVLGHHLSSPDYPYQHPKAAELLLSVAKFLHAAGPGTLVLQLDETENIDKQHDVRGRRKSYATLGRFQECSAIRTILFITPRFEHQTAEDLRWGASFGQVKNPVLNQ